MQNTGGNLWRILEFFGGNWAEIWENLGIKNWEKNFEKNIGKIFEGE